MTPLLAAPENQRALNHLKWILVCPAPPKAPPCDQRVASTLQPLSFRPSSSFWAWSCQVVSSLLAVFVWSFPHCFLPCISPWGLSWSALWSFAPSLLPLHSSAHLPWSPPILLAKTTCELLIVLGNARRARVCLWWGVECFARPLWKWWSSCLSNSFLPLIARIAKRARVSWLHQSCFLPTVSSFVLPPLQALSR